MQSTLDQEIYSKAFDTSYLDATDNAYDSPKKLRQANDSPTKKLKLKQPCNAFDSHMKLKGTPSTRRPHGVELVCEDIELERVESFGMLSFSLEYKQDIGTLYIIALKAEGLMKRSDGTLCNPYLHLHLTPTHHHRFLESKVSSHSFTKHY